MKMKGSEWNRFYNDSDWWKSDYWLDNSEITVNEITVDEYDCFPVPDDADVEIKSGVVYFDFYEDYDENGNENFVDIFTFFNQWKQQSKPS